MKKSVLFFASALLAAASLFVACNTDVDSGTSSSSSSSSSVKEKGSGSLVGVVLDNRGEPVEGALVTLGNKSTKTNKGGEFELSGINVNDPVVRAVQTTVSTDGKLTSKDSTTIEAKNAAYTLTVKKDGYLSGTVGSMYVSAGEDIGGIEDARLASLIDAYKEILKAYAESKNEITTAAGIQSGDPVQISTASNDTDKNPTFKTLSEALKEIQDFYKNLDYTYTSTFVDFPGLVPLDASLSGTIKLSPSPATAEEFDANTYAPTAKPTVKVTYKSADGKANYTFDTTADENGNFKFEKLPSGAKLAFAVEGFVDNAGSVEAYFSTDAGKEINGATKANSLILLNNDSFKASEFILDEKSLNVEGLKVLLFAQLDKVWVVETNLTKNNSAALLKVTDAITFKFNKNIKRLDLEGSGLLDVKDNNYTVKINGAEATVTPNDGVWNTAANKVGTTDIAAGTVLISVLAEDGTVELFNNKFSAYFDDTIYVEISDSSKNDVELGLTQPVKLTFSKPMKTASVVAYGAYDTTKLTNAFSKTWNTEKTELTLTPTTFWDKVSDADGKVVFTVEGVAADETNTVKYWKNNLQADATDATKKVGLIAYFDNKIDVTVAKVSDKAFTLTFSKAIKALTKEDIASAVTVTWATTKAGLATGTAVSDFEAKFNDANTVLTISAKNNDFANTGYYRVALTDAVVGKTGETKFRVAGTTNALTTVAFDTDFTVGPEKFAETTVEIVEGLPAGAELSRAVYVGAEKYLKLTFNKDVRTSDLKVYDKSTTSYKAVRNYVFEKSVYLALNELSDDSDLKVQGTVTATDGAKKEWEAGKELDTGYALSKLTYKVVSTSLYSETVSIAAGQNDATVEKIQPTDNITFTFDQDVSTANWKAELYDSDNVASNDLTQTSYAVTATASGKVVTVALTTASKKLEFGKTYYLSLKATKGNDVDTVVLFNSDKAATTDFADLVSAPGTSLYTKVIDDTTVTSHKYIKINTVDYYVVPAGDKSATTKFDDFKKSINSAIVIEFTQDITGFTAVLADKDSTNYFYDWKKTTDVVAAKTYASTYAVEGKKITITPKYAFASQAVVVPYVFNAKGEIVALKDAAGNDLISKTDTTKQFIAKDTTTADKDLSAALESATASASLALTQFNVNETGNGTAIYFQFKPILSETSNDATYGKYTLYRKAIAATTAATKWEKVGKSYVISDSLGTDEEDLYYIDVDANDTDAKKVANYKKAGIPDFRLRSRLAAIRTTTKADEFDYSETSEYRLVCSIDNVEIYSEKVTVTDKYLNIDTNGSDLVPGGFTTETAVSVKTYTFTSPCYLLDVSTTVTQGQNATVLDSNKRLGPSTSSRVKATLDGTRKIITVTIDDETTAGVGDKITVTAKDAAGVQRQIVIEYKQ